MITIDIPMLPPSVNHMYKSNGRGGKFLTDEAQTFRQLVTIALLRQNAIAPAGPLRFDLLVVYGTRHRNDVDNRIKSCIDAVALALGFDDRWIHQIIATYGGVRKQQPHCTITLQPWSMPIQPATQAARLAGEGR